jgi:hypothetical protein
MRQLHSKFKLRIQANFAKFLTFSQENLFIFARNFQSNFKMLIPASQQASCHGNREHIFWLLVSYRAAEKVKYDFKSSV